MQFLICNRVLEPVDINLPIATPIAVKPVKNAVLMGLFPYNYSRFSLGLLDHLVYIAINFQGKLS